MKIEELFTTPQSRHKHFEFHIKSGKDALDKYVVELLKQRANSEDITDEELEELYEKVAEEIQDLPVDNQNVFGYEVESNNPSVRTFNKYDKSTNIVVVYTVAVGTKEKRTITFYGSTFLKFKKREKRSIGPIPKKLD